MSGTSVEIYSTTSVVELDKEAVAELFADAITVVEATTQGPPGPAGNALITGTAGQALGGHRMVTTNASNQIIYASNATPAHAGRVIGMTTGAASNGAEATIQTSGAITESGWAWTPGSLLWLTTDGQISSTPPATGWVQAIGYAQTATTIFLHLQQAISR